MLADDYLSLQPIIDGTSPATPVMPLTHGTGSISFFKILSDGVIRTQRCEVYDEDLVYLFYARPAYRPNAKVVHTSDSSFRPISFVLHPNALGDARRVVSLDSGALSRGLFSGHLAPELKKENFEILSGIDAAQRCVAAFFGNNQNYYLGKVKPGLRVKPTQLAGQGYLGILSSTAQSALDDRRGTVEMHFAADIPLTKDTVLAVAMPSDFVDDDDLLSFILLDLEADIIEYDVYHDRPVHDVREIIARVKDYYKARSLL